MGSSSPAPGRRGPSAAAGDSGGELPKSPRSIRRLSATIDGVLDVLDLKLVYCEMSDGDLPDLPSNPPSMDDDMLRWQQYQRLKVEYRERALPLRFSVWPFGKSSPINSSASSLNPSLSSTPLMTSPLASPSRQSQGVFEAEVDEQTDQLD